MNTNTDWHTKSFWMFLFRTNFLHFVFDVYMKSKPIRNIPFSDLTRWTILLLNWRFLKRIYFPIVAQGQGCLEGLKPPPSRGWSLPSVSTRTFFLSLCPASKHPRGNFSPMSWHGTPSENATTHLLLLLDSLVLTVGSCRLLPATYSIIAR